MWIQHFSTYVFRDFRIAPFKMEIAPIVSSATTCRNMLQHLTTSHNDNTWNILLIFVFELSINVYPYQNSEFTEYFIIYIINITIIIVIQWFQGSQTKMCDINSTIVALLSDQHWIRFEFQWWLLIVLVDWSCNHTMIYVSWFANQMCNLRILY